jgi:hypothetical protein
MDIQSHEVAESVRHKHGPQPDSHHGIYVSLQYACRPQLLQLNSFCQPVHVHPAHPGLDGGHYSTVCLQDSIVDDLLLLSELAIGRERTGDVTGIAAVFTSHVKQAAYTKKEKHDVIMM